MTTMLKFMLTALLIASTAGSLWAQETKSLPGPLVIVGGGGTPDVVLDRALELAGGKDRAAVLIFPQASRRPEAGKDNRAMWARRGAKTIEIASFGAEDVREVRAQLERCTLIWFSGGSQNRLMTALKEADLEDAIRKARDRGAVVGGTSAGAAVMSARMLTGESVTKAVLAGTTELAEGLGLAAGSIIDQHFHARRRFNRLLSAVADHPQQLGLGIDERTAVIWHGDAERFEVLGEGSVAVLDARKARTRKQKGAPLHIDSLQLHNLVSGDAFDLAGKQVVRSAAGSRFDLSVVLVGQKGTREKAFMTFLKQHFRQVQFLDRKSGAPVPECDVVVLDWQQGDYQGGFPAPVPDSPLGSRAAWNTPTLLIGSAGLNLAMAWGVRGGSG